MARPRTHTTELRDRLLACALEVVHQEGFGALPLRDIAERAGTSTTAVYSLFGNKEGLQRAVLVAGFSDFADAQDAMPASDRDVITEIAGLGAIYVQWATDHPRLYEVMFGEALAGITPTPELQEARERAMGRIADAVRRALASGAFRPAEAATVMTSLWAQVHGLASLIIAGQLPPDADPGTAAWAAIAGWLPA